MHKTFLPDRIVFAYIEEPPFAWTTSEGGAEGCDVDLARTVLQALGAREVVLQATTFEQLLPGVAAGRWHINTPLFVTPQRGQTVAFSQPVWALHDGFIVRAGNPLGLDSYRAIAEAGARLGVVTGQVQHDAARLAQIPTQCIQCFSTQAEAVQALRDDRIDAYASTAVGNRIFVAGLGDRSVEAVDVRAPAGPPPVGAFSFAPGAVTLRQRFDAALSAYLGSAAHRARMAHYGLSASEIDPVLPPQA
jgi:polar amino acid transport system substrate-binding protein